MPLIRLMPGYDPHWRERLDKAASREHELMELDRPLTDTERDELAFCHAEMRIARDSRFRTTADYRDHFTAYCRTLLEREGIDMPLPSLPDDCTKEQVDAIVDMVWKAVETTNSENF